MEGHRPWFTVPINAFVVAPNTESVDLREWPFELNMPIMEMPAHFGSKTVASIKSLLRSFLPFTNFAVSFQPDLNDPNQKDTYGTRVVL